MQKEIGRKVKLIRETKGMTQEKLAEAAGVSWSSISRLENGKISLSLAKLLQIAQVLDVELKVLLSDIINAEKDAANTDFLTEEILSILKPLSDNDKKYVLANLKLIIKHYSNNH